MEKEEGAAAPRVQAEAARPSRDRGEPRGLALTSVGAAGSEEGGARRLAASAAPEDQAHEGDDQESIPDAVGLTGDAGEEDDLWMDEVSSDPEEAKQTHPGTARAARHSRGGGASGKVAAKTKAEALQRPNRRKRQAYRSFVADAMQRLHEDPAGFNVGSLSLPDAVAGNEKLLHKFTARLRLHQEQLLLSAPSGPARTRDAAAPRRPPAQPVSVGLVQRGPSGGCASSDGPRPPAA